MLINDLISADWVSGWPERACCPGRLGVCKGGHPEVRVPEGADNWQAAGNLPLHQGSEVSLALLSVSTCTSTCLLTVRYERHNNIAFESGG